MPLVSQGGSIFVGVRALADEVMESVDTLLGEFDTLVATICAERGLRAAQVRSRLSCNSIIWVNSYGVYVAAEPTTSLGSGKYLGAVDRPLTLEQVLHSAQLDHGLKDPFGLLFAGDWLSMDTQARAPYLRALAESHIEAEVSRYAMESQMLMIRPLFGPPAFRVQENLCFVLMPFSDDLAGVYSEVVRPTVESKQLVCRRADEIYRNGAIMSDVWKSICEARVIIADLTHANANVFYELGIAHTVGKETILIRQPDQPRVPFDLAHIRHIQYTDSVAGASKLRNDLDQHLENILHPEALSS